MSAGSVSTPRKKTCKKRRRAEVMQAACSECGKVMYDKHVLRKHVNAIHRMEKHTCTQCGAMFSWERALRTHVTRKHALGSPPHACAVCSFATRTRTQLRLHADARHGTSAKHLCHTCGFVCRAPSVFHRHVATHGGGGAHSCHACAFTSRTPAALLRHHARDHVPRQQHPLSADDDDVERFWRYESAHAQPYRCLVCTYACCFKHNVRLHVKRHFNIREHACTRCDKRFVSSAAAHAHERQTHDKLHAYVCCYCDFSSPYWRTVDQHKKRRHEGAQAVQVAETPQSTD